jgi:nucleoside-diphosphate-sugar epimerase
LENEVGANNVVAADLSDKKVDLACKQEILDVSDFKAYERIVKDNKIDYIVHLAAILSALGEKFPDRTLQVNIDGALNALNLAKEYKCQVFIPSTIAVFGGDKFPKINTPVDTIL